MCNFAADLHAHAKLHFSPRTMCQVVSWETLATFPHVSTFLRNLYDFTLVDEEETGKMRMRRTARTLPNVISISCLRTRVGLHISDTVGGPTAVGARRMHSPRDAFFMAATVGKGRETMEPCGLWIIHRWRMDAGIQPAWLVSAVSARRDSADEQIFYKRAGNWHGPHSHFRGSTGISRRRLIVTRAADFAARWIFLP